ncbi:nuclear transport factor 2 family protein [Aureisphaera sp. CAU 1614]|uniref:Nuclear transport factor 2 family protein n=1 Tax=Halomarinibacterium sedimenti TaxID=2857106 RepID=A0A9X1JVX2_9FLAO|nr:nuclear transport factor 2 family protein [Halomarinibacterium sedimenti]MBW2938240.1 nuclear transport factor 2 family protein [Halomarinibacterium sedimenti]
MQQLIQQWFALWERGDFLSLPISDDFVHTSPFGTITGKKAYLDLVQNNKDKFLGYTFTLHDAIYGKHHGCVRYTAKQGDSFSLDVSEWYYSKDNLIQKIVAYYHIGDIREERKLKES